MAFLVDALKKNRKASYRDIKAKADEKKLKLFPIMFGRAQAMLGIVKSAKRGTGKFAKASAAAKAGKAGSRATGSSKSDQVRALLGTGMSATDIAKKVGCTVNLVYVIKSKMGQAGKRGPASPRKVSMSGMDDLQGIVAAVKNTERERAQMRAALEKIQAVLADALA